jgi:predicted AlkP superfamily phosphohydrolase/phosphomutase
MTVYDGSDRVQHFFWKYFDESHPRYTPDSPLTGAIEEYYKTVDRGIGRILDDVDDDCDIIVISDHGFGPLSSDIYIDEWLAEEGFLSRRSKLSDRKTVDDVLSTTLKAGWRAVKRADLDSAVRSLLPASWFQRGKNLQDDSHRDIIWDETQVFFGTLSGQALFVNLQEDFNEGTVSQNQYDEVVAEVRRSLLSLQHPETGEKLVEEVIRSDEAFDGWRVEQAPDLIVRTVPDHTLKGGRSDTLVQPSAQNDHDRSGDHRTNGIFLAAGPSFRSDSIEEASVLDIAPTLLYLQDTPIPESMDGSVLIDSLDNNLLNRREVRTTMQYGRSDNGGRKWTDNDETELENRLSDMGYLD